MNDTNPVSTELSPLERAVLDVALARNAGNNALLRSQADAACVATRTPSGVGFMTKLRVPEALAIPDAPDDDTLPTVYGAHPQLPSGAEFVVQIRAGRLNTIEAFCFEGLWPDDESGFRVEVRP